MPRATIGITCYNAAETIGRAIRSALAQDCEDIEVIVVDDVSTDGSLKAAAAAIAEDPRARIVSHARNKGPAGSRNTILREARGAFVVFFDDDDASDPRRVSHQIERIEAYEKASGCNLVACYAAGIRIYPNGYSLDLPAIGSKPGTEVPGNSIADYLLLFERLPNLFYGAGIPACALAMRRSVLERLGGFDENLRRVEDADLAIRLGLAGGHCIGTQNALFTQYATVAGDKSADRNFEAEQRLVDKNRDYLRAKNLYRYARLWPELRYWHFKANRLRFFSTLALLLCDSPIRTVRHLLTTAPKRARHEAAMRAHGPDVP
jgi:glycosyltransferase involved in cell wall biosynthesis